MFLAIYSLMKTILITISRGFLARNILQTDVFPELLRVGMRVVLATPAADDEDFRQTFTRENVAFEKMIVPRWKFLDRVIVGLHRNLVWSRSVEFTAKYGVYDPDLAPRWRYWLQLWFWRPLAHLPVLRRMVRIVDAYFCRPPQDIFEQMQRIKPDLFFSTNPMEDADSYYLKAARACGVRTVGLVKSWDNMSKTNFRILPDHALVWGPYMHDEARRFQQFPEERILETGAPQFDRYVRRDELRSREGVLLLFHLDPNRRTILFGSEGKVTPNDPEIVRSIAEMIRRQELPALAQVLVRPHFGYKRDDEKFDAVADLPHVAVDRLNIPRPVFYDQWDFSVEHARRLPEELFASDVLVTTASTLAIDAAACGLPVICVAYDGARTLPHRHSVARWYETEYYTNVLKENAIVLAKNDAELRAALIAALAHPERRQKERQRLVERFAGILDGKAGKRIADFLTSLTVRHV